MRVLKAWLTASRLRTLPLALSSILMGTIIAAARGQVDISVFTWASITAIFLQVLSNLSNDYGDFVSGIDNQSRVGPRRMVQRGVITARQMRWGMFVCGLLAFLSGSLLIFDALDTPWVKILFFMLGILAIMAAVKYTVGKKPYGYQARGDIAVFIFFGITGVAGTWLLHGNSWEWLILLPAATIGLFATGVMNINNMRDIESDSLGGKITIAAKFGQRWAAWYQVALVTAGWLAFVCYVVIVNGWHIHWPAIITLPLFVKHLAIVLFTPGGGALDKELPKLSIASLLFVFLNGISLAF